LTRKTVVIAALCAAVVLVVPARAGHIFSEDSHFWYKDELVQTGMLQPDGIVSVWGSAKPVPALLDSRPRWYYAVTFNAGVYSDIWAFYSTSGNDVFGVAYSVFDPANIQSGYLGDSGDLAANDLNDPFPMWFSVAPGTNFTIVFSDYYGGAAAAETTTKWRIEGFEPQNPPGTQTPEPASSAMLAAGLALAGLARWWRNKSA
jgi:hypothetical protein